MKRRVFTTIIVGTFVALAGIVYASASGKPVAEGGIVDTIIDRCSSIETMKCDFRQIRRIPLMDEPQESAGRMLYRRPSALKWLYTEPFSYSFKIEDDNISIDTDEGHTEIGSDAARMFKGLSGLVLGCMSGENLRDKRMFQTTVSDENGEWIAVLVPQRREMKRVFSEIVLVFDPSTSLLKRLTMKSQNGDTTEVLISNVSINGNYEAEW